MCLVNDEPAPICCQQSVRWLSLYLRDELRGAFSNLRPLPESFPPLEVRVSFKWLDDLYVKPTVHAYLGGTSDRFSRPSYPTNTPGLSLTDVPPNSFSVPEDDDDDNDDDDDDDVEIIYESVRAPKVEVVIPPRKFTVPESDISCAGSFDSDDTHSEASTPKTTAVQLDTSSHTPVAPTLVLTTTQAENKGWALLGPPQMTYGGDPILEAQSATEVFQSAGEEIIEIQEVKGSTKAHAVLESNLTGPPREPGTKSVVADEQTFDEDVTESEVGSSDDGSRDPLVDDSEDVSDGFEQSNPQDSLYEDSDEDLLDGNRGNKLPGGTTNLKPVYTDNSCPASRSNEHVVLPRETASGDGLGVSEFLPKIHRLPRTPVYQPQCVFNETTGARAPSPSDAAMAKASENISFMTGGGSAGAAQPPVAFTPPSIVQMTSDFQAPRNSTWPYSSSWYGDNSCQYPEYYPAYDPCHLSYQPAGPFQRESIFGGQGGTVNSPFSAPSFANIDPPSVPETSYRNSGRLHPARLQHQSPPESLTTFTTKVSINDIVDKAAQDQHHPLVVQNLKRKADNISGGEERTNEDESEGLGKTDSASYPDAQLQDHFQEFQPAEFQSTTITNPPAEPPAREVQITQEIEQRPAKRMKTTKSIGRGRTAKYAAAVLAGAVIGGVGTIAALVALPPDFFV